MTINRFKVLWYFLLKNRNGVRFKEIVEFFFAPSYMSRVRNVIVRIENGLPYNKVYFKDFTDPLWYPASFPYSSLVQVTGEAFFKDNWHFYEIPETTVNCEDIVVDCGAAEGLFSFLVVSRCKKIYLIEPLGTFCDSLNKTFSLNKKVEIIQKAISSESGIAKITESNISSSLSLGSEGTEVKVTTLDELFFYNQIPVSYIKVDLEGYDFEALKGGKKLIERNRPKIAITTYHSKKHAEQISIFLKSIVPEYNIKTKGIYQLTGSPVMLHAWV